jgi:hypothetical protein
MRGAVQAKQECGCGARLGHQEGMEGDEGDEEDEEVENGVGRVSRRRERRCCWVS